MKQKIIIPGIAVFLLLGIGIMGLSVVYARSPQSISQRYEVEAVSVEDAIKELHDLKAAEKYAFWAENLDSAVHRGKITNEQKEAIIDKAFVISERLAEISVLPEHEQYQELKSLWQEVSYWAQDRGVSTNLLKSYI